VNIGTPVTPTLVNVYSNVGIIWLFALVVRMVWMDP